MSPSALDPGGSVVIRFVDEAGRPVERVVAYGRFPEGADDGDHNVYDATSAKVGGLGGGVAQRCISLRGVSIIVCVRGSRRFAEALNADRFCEAFFPSEWEDGSSPTRCSE